MAEEPEQFDIMNFKNDRSFAESMDASDELAPFRHRFVIPSSNGNDLVYFLGNSLGLQPRSVVDEIKSVIDQWGKFGVEGFFHGDNPWMNEHEKHAKRIAGLFGALPSEITIMNQLTVNLHLLLTSFYQPQGRKRKIVCEHGAFPSDQYMLETFLKAKGLDPDDILIEVKPGEDGLISETSIFEILNEHSDDIALLFFGGVNYYTGQLFDMAGLTKAAHSIGAIAGFDLAHAAGNAELKLHDWNVDFAAWCNYKYLNSGPGSVATAFIHERYHQDSSRIRLAGWWGYNKATRFMMQKGFVPETGAEGWQLSTPSMLLLACHKAATDIFLEAGMERMLRKSRLLASYLLFLLDAIDQKYSRPLFRVLTPGDPGRRGCQTSLEILENGKELHAQLIEKGFVLDWREPSVIRLAPVPLYNSFTEIFRFARTFEEILDTLASERKMERLKHSHDTYDQE
jgi:kynureninase